MLFKRKWTTRRHRFEGILFFAVITLIVLYVFILPFNSGSIECFDETIIGGIPDILDDEAQLPTKGRSIFFHETSCHRSSDQTITITSRQACAIESAARLNPNFTVFVLYASPIKAKNNSLPVSKTERILNELYKYKNIRIRRVDLKRYTKSTPLENWYANGKLQNSNYPNSHASDVLRYLSLWKYGGIYLDLDFVMIKSLEDLQPNFAAAESLSSVAAGVLNFHHQGVGKEIADICINEIKTNFQGKIWGYNGPGVITRALQKICKTSYIRNMTSDRCSGFNVLPPSSFYPIPWNTWSLYFDMNNIQQVMEMTRSSYAIHVWNKFSYNTIINTRNSEVAYGAIAKKFCPNVYRESGDEF